MKKIVKNTLLILVAILILEFVVFIFKSYHETDYKIVNKDESFNVFEVYKNNKYYFKVNYKKKDYYFSYDNKFFKAKKVLKNIIYYEKDDLSCIYPVFKNDRQLNIICNLDDKLYTYSYYEEGLKDMITLIDNNGYDISRFSDNAKPISYDSNTVYKDNILDNTYIYVWKYNGFYTLNNKKLAKLNLFKEDTYTNSLGVSTFKYYVMPNYDQKYEYNSFYIINMTNNKIRNIILKKKKVISSDYYINGVVNDKIYIFDSDKLKQYVINPKKGKIEETVNSENKGLYYDGEFKRINIYDFKEEKKIFKEDIKLPDKIKDKEVIGSYFDNYYYKEDNDIILYNETLEKVIYLFKIDSKDSILINKDTIYYIDNNTLYYFNINTNSKKVITYDELLFNKVNRYFVYSK